VPVETASHRYERYAAAIRGETLPLAIVDLDALERNVACVIAPAAIHGKSVRIASKSIRSVDLLRRIAAAGGDAIRGVMAYCAAEASFLAKAGFDDVLIAYPTLLAGDARRIAEANATGAVVRATVDAGEHLAVLDAAAGEASTRVPVVVDIDVAYRALGMHIGVRRSPLQKVSEIVALVQRIGERPGLSFAGLLAYEAHVAGVGDKATGAPGADSVMENAVIGAMKRFVRGPIRQHRQAVLDALSQAGVAVPLFNGGGTGSIGWTASELAISEVAAGSGFLASHLFDRYRDITLEPAACFALQAVRKPSPGFVTCLGGGFIASGAAGVDRLPQPYLPSGLRLTKLEGAGEVQTPLIVPAGVDIALGSPVFFRHAKAGELAEHFNEYVLVRGDRIEGRATTYRGAGRAFL
jgi:D-serine deaminase-like pyridoxal phosphate-dependent protein